MGAAAALVVNNSAGPCTPFVLGSICACRPVLRGPRKLIFSLASDLAQVGWMVSLVRENAYNERRGDAT